MNDHGPIRPGQSEKEEVSIKGFFDQALRQDFGSLSLFYGHPSVVRLGILIAACSLIKNEGIIFIDGANAFDPYLISRIARSLNIADKGLLNNIHISRAFTCHQLEAAIADRLGPAFIRYGSSRAVISGLINTFYDQEVPITEAAGILTRILKRLKGLAKEGYLIIMTSPDPPGQARRRSGERYFLNDMIKGEADRVFKLAEEAGRPFILLERPESESKRWDLPAGRF